MAMATLDFPSTRWKMMNLSFDLNSLLCFSKWVKTNWINHFIGSLWCAGRFFPLNHDICNKGFLYSCTLPYHYFLKQNWFVYPFYIYIRQLMINNYTYMVEHFLGTPNLVCPLLHLVYHSSLLFSCHISFIIFSIMSLNSSITFGFQFFAMVYLWSYILFSLHNACPMLPPSYIWDPKCWSFEEDVSWWSCLGEHIYLFWCTTLVWVVLLRHITCYEA